MCHARYFPTPNPPYFPPFPPISPPLPPFFQTPKSLFGELVNSMAGSGDARGSVTFGDPQLSALCTQAHMRCGGMRPQDSPGLGLAGCEASAGAGRGGGGPRLGRAKHQLGTKTANTEIVVCYEQSIDMGP